MGLNRNTSLTKKHLGAQKKDVVPSFSQIETDRKQEILRDLEDINSGKIKPTWAREKKSDDDSALVPIYKGSTGINYRVGTTLRSLPDDHSEPTRPKLFITSGEGVFSFSDQQTRAVYKYATGQQLDELNDEQRAAIELYEKLRGGS